MRPRGQTPRMRVRRDDLYRLELRFNEAAGADPADAPARAKRETTIAVVLVASMRPRGQTPRMRPGGPRRRSCRASFNEAAGADPADAPCSRSRAAPCGCCFNEAAGADPADAPGTLPTDISGQPASMRPRGQTPRMRVAPSIGDPLAHSASMRPRGQTPRMPPSGLPSPPPRASFNEAAGADPADARFFPSDGTPTIAASMRPRGQTPRMPRPLGDPACLALMASMRPRGQTPRMPHGAHEAMEQIRELQ